ncbi:apolipoprotein acyltransferase [Massilia sp. Root351]|jgi:apolipoprotein N-acyltransferase|uniref:apolipoprotein N-acyltransferase n=1 Tax=Massilia sp. Root351 TaxID=1736522 RepID=UPI00070E14CC|nr:apolipoprotein N-acyltransferase [Massilia sp. Root351]KQV82223.1 apolipoprotein acyltransferase [Massilia sp. Root351]
MKQSPSTSFTLRAAACILSSAALSALYVRGGAGWLLGFVFLAPWLRALDSSRALAGTLLNAYAMTVAYTAAGFAWFGTSLGQYAGVGGAAGLALLLLAAPLFQPQFFAFALVRRAAARRHGAALTALAAAAAWVAAERLLPRLLGDTLGYGLYPSLLLRQAADLGGAAGLTVLLLLANEGVAAAHARRADGWRAAARPLALAALAPLLLAGYGLAALSGSAEPAGKPLRMGLIQANLIDYEGQRERKGAYAVVREVLDTHFAMSYDAVVRQRADAVLWSETAYPTTFGQPKSEAGAAFDREILANVNAAGVPFVFGTYERDGAGEYNAAAFVQPGTGLLGYYRKTRLFPFTEYVPAWLDGPALRRQLPWTGSWRPGSGARVFPLRLADGREVPVLPLICLDDTDAGLAVDGARLGAQAILTMSNDSWFSASPQGAQLHQAVAAFRSIETRLPQFRVTSNGYSAAIAADGGILTGTRMGEPALLIADVPVRKPPTTLMVLWGDWVGAAACVFLLLMGARLALRPRFRQAAHASGTVRPMVFPTTVALLPPAARIAAGTLRAIARLGLLGMCIALLFDEPLRTNTLAQIRMFAALFLIPETVARCLLRAFAAQVTLEQGRLVLARGAQRLELSLREIGAVELWRLPVPGPGATVRLASGQRWRYGLALAYPVALSAAMAAAGGPPVAERPQAGLGGYAQARLALRRWKLDHPLCKFLLLPLALAIPAFHLHQHIAFGSALGEYYTFGPKAYLSAFALWWAAWAIGVVLCAALLRAGIEAATLLAALLRPSQTVPVRLRLERAGHAALYVGLPAWLLLNLYGK